MLWEHEAGGSNPLISTMKTRDFLVNIFCDSSTTSVSSKRLFGGFGFLVGTGIIVYDTIVENKIPEVFDLYFITCCSLLGLDSVTEIFKNRKPSDKRGTDNSSSTSKELRNSKVTGTDCGISTMS